MESVDESSAVEIRETMETKSDKASKGKAAERVSLVTAECSKVDRWLKQVNESSRGFLTLTRSDVVNFLVRHRKDEFLPKELSLIRADHYDPIRHITWIAPQIKAALQAGNMARVTELQTELRGVELSVGTKMKNSTDEAAARGMRVSSRTKRTKLNRAQTGLLVGPNDDVQAD